MKKLIISILISLSSQSMAICHTQLSNGNNKLIISMNDDQTQNIWPETMRENLTFCVDNKFGKHHSEIVQWMIEATRKWSYNAGINFIYDARFDEDCSKTDKTVFSVTKAGKRLPFSMRAFFPDEERKNRKIRINARYLNNKEWVRTTLIHEVGHVLGFRHEQVHPENQSTCYENGGPFKPITSYDPSSIMHYTRCGGVNEGELSAEDIQGVQIVYPKI